MGGSLFTGLNIGLSGLEAQQSVLSVTAHNVANASTPGFSRQEADLAPNPPYAPPSLGQGGGTLQYGMGVRVAQIQRVSSHFLNLQLWSSDAQLGAASQQTTTLGQVQAMLNEPSSTGINSALSAFWNSWQALGNDAASTAARSQVLDAGQALASRLTTLSGEWTGLTQSLNTSVGQSVATINGLTGQIAALNGQIAASTAAGQSPNDLEDSRNRLITQLASLVPVSVSWQANGQADVSLAGVQAVTGTSTLTLNATPNPANQNFLALSWGPAGIPAQVSGGSLGATLTLRDQTVPGYLAQLNALASGVATAVNAQHAQGYDATGASTASVPFFTSSGGGTISAANLAVNPNLVANPGGIGAASSATSGPGDGSNAVAIANLQNSAFLAGGTETPGAAYATLVGQVGSDTSTAQGAKANQQTLQQSIQNQQQQVSGVSINGEMTTMVEAQNAYAAAARVVTTIDGMLGTLIGMVQ